MMSILWQILYLPRHGFTTSDFPLSAVSARCNRSSHRENDRVAPPICARPDGQASAEAECLPDEPIHIPARVGMLSVAAPRPPAVSVDPVGVPARLPSAFPSSRASPQRGGRARGEAGGSVSPGTLPAADVGAMPTWHRNALGSRAGSPTRATCCKAIFSRSSPPYPKGGA